ncbi:MAG: MMPL family transporter [Bacteroidetes bacterium]|nr:MMPL family transporter [Bacteroidota bacterium]
MNRFSELISRFRIPVILACWLIAIVWIWQVPKAKINPAVEAMIPETMESRQMTDSIESIFGGSNMVLIILEHDDVLSATALARIQSISDDLMEIAEIERLVSPFNSKMIYGHDGMMMVEPAIPFHPETEKEKDSLQNIIRNNPLIMDVCFSDNFKYAAIIGTLQREIDNISLLNDIRQIVKNNPGEGNIYIGGLPVVNEAITSNITKDLWILLPLALLLMVLTLLFAFRSILGLILPFSVVIMAIAVSMGLIPVFNWSIAIVTVLLPVMLIAIANNYGIHLLNKDMELEKAMPEIHGTRRIKLLWQSMGKPVILTGLTTIAGILGLVSHIIIPARQVGILAAIGIAWALLISLIYIPAWLSGKRKKYTASSKHSHHSRQINLLLTRMGMIISQKPGRVLIISGIALIIISLGLSKLRVDGNTVNFFNKNHEVRQSAELIDTNFGGSQSLLIQFTGNIRNPDLLRKMDACGKQLVDHPGVGNVMSICDVIKIMSKAILDPMDEGYGKIPDTQAAVSQYFELYSFSGDPADFEQLVDFNYENAIMIVRLNDGSASSILKVRNTIQEMLGQDPILKRIGGIGLITSELTNSLITGQKRSLAWALIVVVILIMFIFRSLKTGLLALIPLVMACLILFGSMGWLNIPLDAATALLSSVMIGVGVDYTIHYLWRHSMELNKGATHSEALITTLTTSGKGIFYNALTVILGFSVLIFSSFNPIRFFGLLTVLSIIACLVGALIIVPAIIMLIKPNFLKTKE